MARYVAAIDQGTTSTRCMVFDHAGREVGRHQLEHQQILPAPGWVEHNAQEIWDRTRTVVETVMTQLDLRPRDLAALGVTNQRETTVVWDRHTGRPLANAIVWQDTRTDQLCSQWRRAGHEALVRERTGLPIATYFSAGKLAWLLEHVPGLRARAEAGDALFGTTDSWLIWHLTGGPEGGRHITDVTNASRTMLMDLSTLAWDEELMRLFGVPAAMLPQIRPSSDPDGYGEVTALEAVAGVPLTGALGDQQAATVGQVCFGVGHGKNTTAPATSYCSTPARTWCAARRGC